jgi:hypothetical protein
MGEPGLCHTVHYHGRRKLDLSLRLLGLVVLVTAALTVAAPGSAHVVADTGAPASPRSVYWGAFMDGNDTYSFYLGGKWGDAPWDTRTWDQFEADAGKPASIIHWGVGTPWSHDFDYHLGVHERSLARGELELIDMNSAAVPLRDIAAGRYDSSIWTWAAQAKAWGHPLFLRWDWEMNGSWFAWGATPQNANTPADYVAAWRHVHDVFEAAGATNVTWVWSPNVEFPGSVRLASLYPGNAYVDWTAMDGYDRSGNATSTFASIFAATYAELLRLAPTKPIMIAEVAASEAAGSKASWIRDALSVQLPLRFPSVRAVVWFNWRISEGGAWQDWPIESSASARQAFAAAIASPYYLPGGTAASLPLFTRIAAD